MGILQEAYKKYAETKGQLSLALLQIEELKEVCGFSGEGDGLPSSGDKGDGAVVNYLSKINELELKTRELSDDMSYYRNIIQVLKDK